MRKLISLGLLALMTFTISPQIYADPADGACETLNELNASPGLYGLCVAYFNANENARVRILANYLKRMQEGDPGMPGIATCQCWADLAELQTWTNGKTIDSCGTSTVLSGKLVFDIINYTDGYQLATLDVDNGAMYFCSVANATTPISTHISVKTF